MNYRIALGLSTMALLYMASSAAVAQSAPPSYQADPDVYKVIFEDQNFRVIASTRKKGVHDKNSRAPGCVGHLQHQRLRNATVCGRRQNQRRYRQGRNGGGGTCDCVAFRRERRSGGLSDGLRRAQIGRAARMRT